MKTSNVVDRVTGKSMVSKVRTSTGHFLTRDQDPVVTLIEERISAFAMVPADHGEGMQVLHYTVWKDEWGKGERPRGRRGGGGCGAGRESSISFHLTPFSGRLPQIKTKVRYVVSICTQFQFSEQTGHLHV